MRCVFTLAFANLFVFFYSYLSDEKLPYGIEDYDTVLPDQYRRAYYS